MGKGSARQAAAQSGAQVRRAQKQPGSAVPQADANTNVVMEAMNIKMTKARYRSGIAFMRSFTGASRMRLHLKGFFGTNSNKPAA
jgi:hypothetical protein